MWGLSIRVAKKNHDVISDITLREWHNSGTNKWCLRGANCKHKWLKVLNLFFFSSFGCFFLL